MEPLKKNKKTFFLLWVLCIVGSWSVLPYVQYLGVLPSTISIWRVSLFGTVQAALFFGFICWLSYKILHKTDLCPFATKPMIKRVIYPAIICGVLVGLVIYLSDRTVFHSSLLSGVHPPFWAGALASLYGGINEEVLLRLFLFTLLYFLIGKCLTITNRNRLLILWSVNILVSLLFGIGHMPTAFKLISPSLFEIFRILFLNGIAGIVFGWLYWSRGLWTAIGAHFITDIMIHVLLI